ncbi:MAG: hypothetical protein AB1346_03470 [Thermodesulfobacteriota bacterium]
MRKMLWLLYIALVVSTVCVFSMGYRQVTLVKADKVFDLTSWVPKKEIVRLMRYHGADGMKITRDAVFIFRNAQWIPVMKRDPG